MFVFNYHDIVFSVAKNKQPWNYGKFSVGHLVPQVNLLLLLAQVNKMLTRFYPQAIMHKKLLRFVAKDLSQIAIQKSYFYAKAIKHV